MANDIYDRIAPYYDLLHEELVEDAGLIVRLAKSVPGPVLELGCGTGRLLVPLAKAGKQVTGLDVSEAMLERARERLTGEPVAVQKRVRLVHAEMTTFKLEERAYSLAVIPYNTFLHLDPKQAQATCKQIAAHLGGAGQLFIDLANPYDVTTVDHDRSLTLERAVVNADNGDTLLVFSSSWLDESAQILNITWIYDATPQGRGSIHRTVAPVRYHYYFPHQLEILLQESGFVLEALYGNYDRTAYGEDAERLLVLARKQELAPA